MKSSWLGATILTLCLCIPAGAQVASLEDQGASSSQTSMAGTRGQNPFLGGVPSGEATPSVLQLTLKEAIDRGLKYNLGLLLSEQGTREARGARTRALSDLLPKVTWQTSETRQQLSLQAFGLTSFPGLPTIVGPFNVFDTRAYLSQPILDFHAIRNTRAESEKQKAAEYSYRDSRDLVVLVCAYLYFGAVADSSRVDAATAELKTAQAIYDQAVDLKKAGVVPGVDVLRAQVELQAQRQRLLYVQNEFQKQKLNLARAIGLPAGQEFSLADQIPYAPAPALTLEEALDRAHRSRADYRSAVALVRAAQSNKKAAQSERLPALRFNADFGDIGLAPGNSHETFTVAANMRVPIFQGGQVRGKVTIFRASSLLISPRRLWRGRWGWPRKSQSNFWEEDSNAGSIVGRAPDRGRRKSSRNPFKRFRVPRESPREVVPWRGDPSGAGERRRVVALLRVAGVH